MLSTDGKAYKVVAYGTGCVGNCSNFIFDDTNMVHKAKKSVDSLSRKTKAELIQIVGEKELVIENLKATISDQIEENERLQSIEEWIDTALMVGTILGIFLLGTLVGVTIGYFIF